MKIFISSILLLLLAPCNNEQKISSTTETTEEFSKISILYAETPCYGECPIYSMNLDGKTMIATFKGEANTPKIGTYTKPISPAEFKQFTEGLEKAGFEKLAAEYMGNIPDFAVREITLTKDGKTKKVRNRSEGPPELNELDKIFRDFANSEGWTKQEGAH